MESASIPAATAVDTTTLSVDTVVDFEVRDKEGNLGQFAFCVTWECLAGPVATLRFSKCAPEDRPGDSDITLHPRLIMGGPPSNAAGWNQLTLTSCLIDGVKRF